VYQYHFEQVPAVKPGAMVGPIPASELGSKHAGEIQYVFETLPSQKDVPWTGDDFKVSETMALYWVNFVKTGNPNGKGLPEWPTCDSKDGFRVMHFVGNNIHTSKDALRARYEFLDTHPGKPAGQP
jgi:para-nitrobenzyl esterase